MFKPGSVNGRRGAQQIQTGEPMKSIRIASDFNNNNNNNAFYLYSAFQDTQRHFTFIKRS